MSILKTVLKMISGFLAGAVIGVLIIAVAVVVFTDTSFAEFFVKIKTTALTDALTGAAIGIAAFIASLIILIPLHEAGHLVCGLLSGYKFVSFRIFSLTFIKLEGKLRLKRYAIAGTGGQCLMTPPDLPLEKIPTAWYNAGGVLANLIALIIVVPMFVIADSPALKEMFVIFILTDIFFILTNGIPIKIGGVGNDAHNMIVLRKNMPAKRALVNALRANALIQQGVRPAALPAEWFETEPVIDYSNNLEVSMPIMAASRLVDEMKFPEALRIFEELYGHKKEIIGLYVKEIECELVFLRLMCGDIEGAKALLNPELKKYIETYRKTMSSKERVLCAISMIIDKDRDKAAGIYEKLLHRESDYLMQGEVKSDLAIIQNSVIV